MSMFECKYSQEEGGPTPFALLLMIHRVVRLALADAKDPAGQGFRGVDIR